MFYLGECVMLDWTGRRCGTNTEVTHTMSLLHSEHLGDSTTADILGGHRWGGGGGSWWARGVIGRGEVARPPTMWLWAAKNVTLDGRSTINKSLPSYIDNVYNRSPTAGPVASLKIILSVWDNLQFLLCLMIEKMYNGVTRGCRLTR